MRKTSPFLNWKWLSRIIQSVQSPSKNTKKVLVPNISKICRFLCHRGGGGGPCHYYKILNVSKLILPISLKCKDPNWCPQSQMGGGGASYVSGHLAKKYIYEPCLSSLKTRFFNSNTAYTEGAFIVQAKQNSWWLSCFNIFIFTLPFLNRFL